MAQGIKKDAAERFNYHLEGLRALFSEQQEIVEQIMGIVGARKKTAKADVKPRAPKGTTTQLINHALASGPKKPAQIKAAARTEEEKLATDGGIRLALEKGRVEKRYVKDSGGAWSLRPQK